MIKDPEAGIRCERGPTARRGRQFAETDLSTLLLAFTRAKATLRLIQGIDRPAFANSEEIQKLKRLDSLALERLRLHTGEMLTDLRAELRRRTQK